jgi:hypothetical protein
VAVTGITKQTNGVETDLGTASCDSDRTERRLDMS